MLSTYNMKRIFTLLIFTVFLSSVSVFAESKEERYNNLMKEGTFTDIKKALISDSEMILTKVGPERDTLLMKAVEYGRAESIVSLMLKAGIKPQTKNRKGQDALMYACRMSQDPNVIRVILAKYGSDSNIKKNLLRKDKTGNSAWDYANQNRGPQAVYIVKKYVGDMQSGFEQTEVAQKTKTAKKDQESQTKTTEKNPVKETVEKQPKAVTKEPKKTGKKTKEKVPEIPVASETVDQALQVTGGKVSFSDYEEEPEIQPQETTIELTETTEPQEPAPVIQESISENQESSVTPDVLLTESINAEEIKEDPSEEMQNVIAENVVTPEGIPSEEVIADEIVAEEIQADELLALPSKQDEAEPVQEVALEEVIPEPEKISEAVLEPAPEPEEENVVVAKSTFGKKKIIPEVSEPVQDSLKEQTKETATEQIKEPVKETDSKTESKKIDKPQNEVKEVEVAVKNDDTSKESNTSKPVENKKTSEIASSETKKETPKKVVIDVPKAPVSKYNNSKYLYDYAPKAQKPVAVQDETNSNLATIDNPNQKDKDGRTALMKAVKKGNDWEIKSLLKSGADVNIQDNDGWSALMYAVRYQNNIEITNLLIKNGADTQLENNFGNNPLSIASCYTDNPEVLRKIISSYPVGSKEIFKAFILAITSNSSSTITKLAKLNVFIDSGIPLNRFYEGKTPLMYAAEYADSTEIIKLLLKNGAITTIRNSEGKTAFNFAEYNSQLEHNEVYWSLNNR